MGNVLEALGICKSYGEDENHINILKDINLNINKGELITMMGRSGSGKTTFLHTIGGILEPDAGKVIINGQSLYELTDSKRTRLRSREIAIIFQNFNLLDDMTVLDNIRLPLDIRREKYDCEMENYLISEFRLKDKIKHYPYALSGGERQRVAIIRALVAKPALILADEPTGNLDFESGRIVLDYINKINREIGQAFLIVTHDKDVAAIGQRVLYMKDGVLEEIKCEKS